MQDSISYDTVNSILVHVSTDFNEIPDLPDSSIYKQLHCSNTKVAI